MIRPHHTPAEADSQQTGSGQDSPHTIDDPRIATAVEQYRAALESGEQPDRQRLLEGFPDLAEELSACLDALEFVSKVAPGLIDSPHAVTRPTPSAWKHAAALGDFRILREIGRGGMGVVYEAEQISLGRSVALKVLPFAAVLDPRQLKRFRREATTAAGLHHPNIVPVYSVGCERSVHFYAMQYIEGVTLSELVSELKSCESLDSPEAREVHEATRCLAEGIRDAPRGPLTAALNRQQEIAPDTPLPTALQSEVETETTLQAAICTERSNHQYAYCRRIAELGEQAAEALDYAHQEGIVHRDVKPSNLILDQQGKLWVTDFGLAHIDADPGLTCTGDIVGTLRYMSPEQAIGNRAVIDHRSDIYSLGITLYELLALRPAFDDMDRQELLRQVAYEEPRPLRRWCKTIPAELETIIQKATAKVSTERYATAQELADDLRRYLEDKPIRARRPTLAQRVTKWSRRHRPVVWTAAVMLVMATLLVTGIGWNVHQQRVELEHSVGNHLVAAAAFLQSGDFSAAREQLGMAQSRLNAAQYRQGQLRTSVGDLAEELAAKTHTQEQFDQFQQLREQVHAEMYAVAEDVRERAQENCRSALALYQVLEEGDWRGQSEFQHLSPQHQQALEEDIAELLFLWARLEVPLRDSTDHTASPETHRRAIEMLKRIEEISQPTRAVLLWIAESTAALGEEKLAQEARQQAKTLPPQTGLDYFMLAELQSHQGRFEEALTSYRLALRSKPDHYLSLLASGVTLLELGHYEPAEHALTGAIAMNRRTILAYVKRARACSEQGQHDLAQADLARALGLDPELATAYYDRGQTRTHGGLWEDHDVRHDRLDRAIADLTTAIQLDPQSAKAHFLRALCYVSKKDLDQAIADYSTAIRLNTDPEYTGAYVNRGLVYSAKGKFKQAIADCEEAIRRNPQDHLAYNNLAHILTTCPDDGFRDAERAVELAQRAVELNPKAGFYWCTLGFAHYRAGNWTDAIESLEKSDQDLDFCFLAMAHWQLGQRDEALRNFAKAAAWIDTLLRTTEAYRLHDEAEELISPEAILSYCTAQITADPQAGKWLALRARTYALLGQYDQAARDYPRAIKLGAFSGKLWYRAALTALESGGKAAYRDVCRLVVERYGQTDDPDQAGLVVWCCTLTPDSGVDPERIVALAQRAMASQPHEANRYRVGVALYRAGQWADAIEVLQRNVEARDGDVVWNTWDYLVLAMAEQRLEHDARAQAWLAKASRWIDATPDEFSWDARLGAEVLREEAKALVHPPTEPSDDRSDAAQKTSAEVAAN